MTQIDKSKPVMVTGATGFVAGWLVKELLENGITVHAAVRDPKNEKKLAHLNKIAANSKGEIKYFKSDLLDKGSYKEAMRGCELIFHTASPFTMEVEDPQIELINPAVNGTQNVLNSASETSSVKRIVLTSSCASIYTDAVDCLAAPNNTLNEDIWNTTASLEYQPYSYSKTLAEQKAWEIAKNQNQWDLVTINPSFVMGPALNASTITSESYNLLTQIGDGTMKKGVPKMGCGLVDVRDVGHAHYQAGFTSSAKGRYITSGHNTNFLEMSLSLQDKYGEEYPIPKKALPKWLLMIVGPMANKLFTRKFIRNNVNIEFKADNSKIKNDLKMNFRPMKDTMEDSFEVLVENDML